jgi:peptidoglycan hydrolase-like protein with peptidoglycan-binding domain
MSDTLVFNDVISYPTLRRGEHHEQVTTLQFLLRHRGHAIAADGDFGPKTEAAVRAFQASVHITVDGIVGKQTWPKLVVTVRRGSTGDAVRAVQFQDFLRDGTGEMSDDFDGVFGPRTESSVREWQKFLAIEFPTDHIAVDGIVGPVTWKSYVSNFMLG